MARPRDYTFCDRLLASLDGGLRTLYGAAAPAVAVQPTPAADHPETVLPPSVEKKSVRMMRVNHTGEICAQALYVGQALVARNDTVRRVLQGAAAEEADHLVWCAERIAELGGRPSILNPAWFSASFVTGAASGLLGDDWSMGFLEETERQVSEHLQGHLRDLPPEDARSRAIVARMQRDETKHAATARHYGAIRLPGFVQFLMRLQARVMTTVAARI